MANVSDECENARTLACTPSTDKKKKRGNFFYSGFFLSASQIFFCSTDFSPFLEEMGNGSIVGFHIYVLEFSLFVSSECIAS